MNQPGPGPVRRIVWWTMNEDWHETIGEHEAVHDWRARQLTRLGIPQALAEAVADHVDWHQIAALVRRGCPPRLALQIVM